MLGRALQKWVNSALGGRMLDPSFDPINGVRNFTVLHATMPAVYKYATSGAGSEKGELVTPKVGADGYIVQLFAEHKLIYKPQTAEEFTDMPGRVACLLRDTLV